MAKPSIEGIVVHQKVGTGPFTWDVEYTLVTEKGTRHPRRRVFPNMNGGAVVAAIKAEAVSFNTEEKAPPAKPLPEFPGRYDATAAGLTVLDPADYPEGEAPLVAPSGT